MHRVVTHRAWREPYAQSCSPTLTREALCAELFTHVNKEALCAELYTHVNRRVLCAELYTPVNRGSSMRRVILSR